MTLLVISPDYASHLLPLATLATGWQERGDDVVVATGPATDPIVQRFGYRRVDLPLGRGANAGVIRTTEQQAAEAASLEGFFAATRQGMIPTLSYQARERLTDLMWMPADRARATMEVIDLVRPDAILVDHLAYSARLALHTFGVGYGDVVLGHPTALPVGEEVYGYPPFWPRAFSPRAADLASLHSLCTEVSRRFTAQWNEAARELDPQAPLVEDAFALHGETVLYNYPAALADGDGRMLPPHVFLGGAVRSEPADPVVEEWIAEGVPYAYVSFGSFLSVRGDVLARVAEALRLLGLRAAVATGATDPTELGPVPEDWLVRDYLPQVRLLAGAAVSVTHGGNNSVTEALAHGVPLVVLPFSTDQFAGAAAIERVGVGRALDPQTADAAQLATAIEEVGSPSRQGRHLLEQVAEEQRARPGARVAAETLSRR